MELASARALGFQLISELYQQAQAGHLPPPLSKQPEAVHYSIRIRCSVASGIFPRLGQHFVVSQSAYRALGQFKLDQPDANPTL